MPNHGASDYQFLTGLCICLQGFLRTIFQTGLSLKNTICKRLSHPAKVVSTRNNLLINIWMIDASKPRVGTLNEIAKAEEERYGGKCNTQFHHSFQLQVLVFDNPPSEERASTSSRHSYSTYHMANKLWEVAGPNSNHANRVFWCFRDRATARSGAEIGLLSFGSAFFNSLLF